MTLELVPEETEPWVNYRNQHVRPHDEFSVPQDWPGHSMALTLMRRPYYYRAECTCGWWVDTLELHEGKRQVRNHKLNNSGDLSWRQKLRVREGTDTKSSDW